MDAKRRKVSGGGRHIKISSVEEIPDPTSLDDSSEDQIEAPKKKRTSSKNQKQQQHEAMSSLCDSPSADPAPISSFQTLYISGVSVSFPFKPYGSQIAMMSHMIRALESSTNTMIESPTGSGKSLALLCAALAWRAHFVKRKSEHIAKVKSAVIKFADSGNELPACSFEDTEGEASRQPKSLALALVELPQTAQFILDTCRAKETGLSDEEVEAVWTYVEDAERYQDPAPTIYFGSRTHRQVSQLVGELRRKTNYRPKSAVLGSKAHMCVNPKVAHGRARRKATVDQECAQLLENDMCAYFSGQRRLLEDARIARTGSLAIWDIEDLVGVGKKVRACAYYASRELAGAAHIVFCPYNYILDPAIREACGIDLERNVVVLDEAHNVENAARDAGSVELVDTVLEGVVLAELDALIKYRVLVEQHSVVRTVVAAVVAALRDPRNVYENVDYQTRTSVWPKTSESIEQLLERLLLGAAMRKQLESAVATVEDHVKEMRQRKKTQAKAGPLRRSLSGGSIGDYEEYYDAHEEPVDADAADAAGSNDVRTMHLSEGALRQLKSLLRVLEHTDAHSPFAADYRVALIRKPNPGRGSDEPPHLNVLAFWAMNPAVVFDAIARATRTVILTSGTLSPLDSYRSELRVDFRSELEAAHVIPHERFWAGAIGFGPGRTRLEAKYATSELTAFQDDVGAAVVRIAGLSPDGMLVFAPSYTLLHKLLARWDATGARAQLELAKRVYVEPQGGSAKDFDAVLGAFRAHLERGQRGCGAVLFAVYRGKVSEGIDFADYLCRTVVNIGIPYPALKDVKVALKREYNSLNAQNGLLDGRAWYDVQAYRAINQALGRCLRHRMDWGAIIMLDHRFLSDWNVAKLSKWVRSHVMRFSRFEDAIGRLEAFYRERVEDDMRNPSALEGDCSGFIRAQMHDESEDVLTHAQVFDEAESEAARAQMAEDGFMHVQGLELLEKREAKAAEIDLCDSPELTDLEPMHSDASPFPPTQLSFVVSDDDYDGDFVDLSIDN